MVRGITNFVRQSTGALLRQHKLKNTYLVIDGKNISFQLYLKHAEGKEFFGGDYDNYARNVSLFFDSLLKCNVTPIVVFDGNNEEKKLTTNFDRYNKRIRAAATYHPALAGPGDSAVYPLFLRTVFTEIINKLDILTYRCEFSADNEIANLAKELNCPVLSMDSDYYIYDVLYVPFNSLNLKQIKDSMTNDYYLNCQLYSCKYFLSAFPGLRWEHMTILATVSGNDYIESDVFESFYNKLGKQKGRAARMRNTINFLKNKSFDLALNQIMDSLYDTNKKELAKKMAENIIGYKYNESCIPNVLDIKNHKANESLKTDISGRIDDFVYKFFKTYFTEDIFEKDKVNEQILQLGGNLKNIDISVSKVTPAWFLLNNQTCVFPAPIFELSFSLMYFLPAIMEDSSNKSVHSISHNILSAMNKILTQTLKGKEVRLAVVSRQDNVANIRKFEIDSYKDEIVALKNIPSLNKDQELEILFKVLNFNSEKDAILNMLEELPSNWHLFVLSVMYWKRNAKSVITDAHLIAAYLSAICLKIIDKTINVGRSLTELRQKYSDLLDSKFDTDVSVKPSDKFDDFVKAVSEQECVLTLQDLIPKFSFNDYSKFDKKVIHAFGELQSCIYFINSLNSLLEEPIEKILIYEFYNDTLLFNTYEELKTCEDLEVALKRMLPNSPIINKICFYINKLQNNILSG